MPRFLSNLLFPEPQHQIRQSKCSEKGAGHIVSASYLREGKAQPLLAEKS